jgi:hypothetical protein
MRSISIAFAALILLIPASASKAQDRTFGDFDCTQDCSGHSAGYKWAEKHSIDDEADCPEGNSQSFHEGCIAYTRDQNMDPDSDDQGHQVGVPVPKNDDDDDDDDDDK